MTKKILVGFIVFITICICISLQINFLNYIPLFGVTANLGLVFIVGIGLLSDKLPGALSGAAYGLLLDLLFGKSLGVYFLIYTLVGYCSGMLSKGFSKDNKLSIIYMTALFTVLTELITYLIFVVIYGYSIELLAVANILLKETVYNVIIARLLFKPLTLIGEIINKSKNSYYLL